MKLAVRVNYTEDDIKKLIVADLQARNLLIHAADVTFRMTKQANRYRLLGADVEVARPVEILPQLTESVDP